jgi:DNA-binding NarL/FixJ family response regulator
VPKTHPGPKVLVVEDFDKFRHFVVSTLQQRARFCVTEASSGVEALQRVEEHQPDLVLLDIGLPSLNGIEVARRLRRLAAPPKIVFLSQESSPDVIGEALNLGALGYVHKVRAGSDLLPAIEAALEGKRFVITGLQIGRGADAQAQPRHEILFCSDAALLLDALVDFVADALKSGNAALVRATQPREASLRAELQTRGLDVDASIQRGTYEFLDVEGPPDPARVSEAIRRLSEAASKAGKKRPCVAFWGELAGRMWEEDKTDEAIRLEQLANELAQHYDIDFLCPYPLPHGEQDPSAFNKVCAEHSVVSFR